MKFLQEKRLTVRLARRGIPVKIVSGLKTTLRALEGHACVSIGPCLGIRIGIRGGYEMSRESVIGWMVDVASLHRWHYILESRV